MSTAEATLSGGVIAAAGEASALGGRVEVDDRVARKVAERVASDVLGVPSGEISVDTALYRGGLGIRIKGPLTVPSLDDDTAVRAAGTVVERAERIQRDIRERVAHVMGRDVTRVDLVIDSARITSRRRVR